MVLDGQVIKGGTDLIRQHVTFPGKYIKAGKAQKPEKPGKRISLLILQEICRLMQKRILQLTAK